MPPMPHPVSDSESRMTALRTQSPNPNHERSAPTGMSATQQPHPSGLQIHWRVLYRLPNHPLQDGRIIDFIDVRPIGQVGLDTHVTIALDQIVGVAQLSGEGETLAAWRVSAHGLDGMKGQMSMSDTMHDTWLKRYQRIRDLTLGLTQEDPRFTPVMAMISQCDRCYHEGDDAQFITVGKRIAALMNTPAQLQSVPPHSSPAH